MNLEEMDFEQRLLWTKRYLWLLRYKEARPCSALLKVFANDLFELNTLATPSASPSQIQLQIHYERQGRQYLRVTTFQQYAQPYNAVAKTTDLQTDYEQLNDPEFLDCLIQDILFTNSSYTEALRLLSHQDELTLFLGFPEARIKRAVETRNRLYDPFERYHTLRLNYADDPFYTRLGNGLKYETLRGLLNLETTEQTTGRDVINAALHLIDDDEKSDQLTEKITAQLNAFMDNLVQIFINSRKSDILVAAATAASPLYSSNMTYLQRSPTRKKAAFRHTPSWRNRRLCSNLASLGSTVHQSASPNVMLSASSRQLPSRYFPPSVKTTPGTFPISPSFASSSSLYDSLPHLVVMACLGATSISQRAFRPSLFAQAMKPRGCPTSAGQRRGDMGLPILDDRSSRVRV